MPRLLIGIMLGSAAFGLSAQSHNIGLYELESVSDGVATFNRVWSAYVPEVANEPLLPGDVIYTPPGGGGGDPPPGHIIHTAPAFDPMLTMGGLIQSDGVIERIEVFCGQQCKFFTQLMYGFLTSGLQGGGSGGGGGSQVLRNTMETPDAPPPCEISNDDLDNIELTEAQLAAINHFMNGAHGQNLWNASSFGAIMEWRQERASTYRPGYGWYQASANWTGPCAGNFQLPWNAPDGSILAHTHPFMAGEPMDLCVGFDWYPGQVYESYPSPVDIDSLIQADGFDLGLIVDYDGIVVYDETGAYDFIEGQCGFERTGL